MQHQLDGFDRYAAACRHEGVREKICYNCGKTGHERKAYNNKTRCYVCNKAGHRADKVSSQVYKRLPEKVGIKKQRNKLKIIKIEQ